MNKTINKKSLVAVNRTVKALKAAIQSLHLAIEAQPKPESVKLRRSVRREIKSTVNQYFQ